MRMFDRAAAIVVSLTLVFSHAAPVLGQEKGGGQPARPGKTVEDHPSKGDVDVRELEQFNLRTLEQKWAEYSNDKGFKALVDRAKSLGFQRIAKNEKTAWGFQGKFTRGGSDKTMSAEVCAFDFVQKTPEGVQMASMVWREVDGEVYKAIVVFPVGEADVQKALANATEHYVDAKGEIQKANSFKTCFNSCLKESSSFCLGLAGACFGFIVTVGVTGIGVLPALGILGACAGICAFPIAVCAVRC